MLACSTDETDDEFAARLASAMSVAPLLPPPSPFLADFRAMAAAASNASMAAAAANAAAGSTPASGRDFSTPREGGARVPTSTLTPRLLAASAAGEASPRLETVATYPTSASSSQQQQQHQQQQQQQTFSWSSPQASTAKPPSAPPMRTAGSMGSGNLNEEEALCVICLTAQRTAGFLHGLTVHRCVCTGCSRMVPLGAPCPLCRQPVERIIGVF